MLTINIFIYFNPRSPYGERQFFFAFLSEFFIFQSTLPLRGATNIPPNSVLLVDISIHAPLTGSDLFWLRLLRQVRYFNPRSPYGERRCKNANQTKRGQFQSTLPLRGATGVLGFLDISSVYFNPRSPYGERRCNRYNSKFYQGFQSTLPLRGATR